MGSFSLHGADLACGPWRQGKGLHFMCRASACLQTHPSQVLTTVGRPGWVSGQLQVRPGFGKRSEGQAWVSWWEALRHSARDLGSKACLPESWTLTQVSRHGLLWKA